MESWWEWTADTPQWHLVLGEVLLGELGKVGSPRRRTDGEKG